MYDGRAIIIISANPVQRSQLLHALQVEKYTGIAYCMYVTAVDKEPFSSVTLF